MFHSLSLLAVFVAWSQRVFVDESDESSEDIPRQILGQKKMNVCAR